MSDNNIVYCLVQDIIERIILQSILQERNDSNSPLFKQRIKEMRKCIEKKNLRAYNSMQSNISGTPDSICKEFGAIFTNECRKVFELLPQSKKFRPDCCDICGIAKMETNNHQLDRAHSTPRPEILRQAIHQVGCDSDTPVNTGVIMKCFILLHIKYPIWVLCKTCHNKYG